MKLKRLIIGIACILVLIPALGWLILTLSVKKFSDPDFLVSQIEQSLNCRAEIKSAELNLYTKPASLAITGIAFGPRDVFVEGGTPLSGRPTLNPSISVDYVYLELETMPLLRQQLVVRNLEIERPSVDLRIYEDGTTSLDELLADVRGKKADEAKPVDTAAPKDPAKSKKFTADDLGLSAIADRFAIDNMTVYATIEKSKITVQIYDVDVIATQIDIDPADLENHNSIQLDYNATIAADSYAKDFRFIDMVLDGKGKLRPFELDTRELHPFLDTQVTVAKDSYIDGLVILDELEGTVRKLEEFGVKFAEDDLRLRGDFSEDTTASFTSHRGRVKMTEDFMIPIDQNFVILRKDSWVDSGADDHEFFITFILSKGLTTKIETELDKFLTEAFGAEMATKFRTAILAQVKNEDFLMLNLSSKGSLGEPQVSVDSGFGKIDAQGLVQGLLKGGSDAGGDKPDAASVIKGLLEEFTKPDGAGEGAPSSAPATSPAPADGKKPEPGPEDPLKDLEDQAKKLLDGFLKPKPDGAGADAADDKKKPEAGAEDPVKDPEAEAKKLLEGVLGGGNPK